MGSLTVVDGMQMELDRLQNVEYAMRRLNAELQVKVEDLEAQLLENTDLGWHNLRNQRDDLLKRVDELEERWDSVTWSISYGPFIQHDLKVADYGVSDNTYVLTCDKVDELFWDNDRYLKALERISEKQCRICESHVDAYEALDSCDPTE